MIGEEMLVDCSSCGKQNVVKEREPDDKCLFCGEILFAKEGVMAEIRFRRSKVDPVKLNELPPVPPKPDCSGLNLWERNMAMKQYYEANKEGIIADFKSLGLTLMLKRWKLSYATWCGSKHHNGLRNRWLPEEFGTASKQAQAKKPAKAGTKEPVFPPFSDKMPAEVQAAWLQVYPEVVKLTRGQK